MKITPRYSYEYNCILNEGFTEDEQIRNFASLISDKERFLSLLPLLTKNLELISKTMGTKLPENLNFYVVRAEKFKSFSDPITIEYSILPEEMLLYLIKEIVKSTFELRFPDELTREEFLNSFIDYICINGDFEKIDMVKFCRNLHSHSQNLYPKYQYKEIDFSKQNLKERVAMLYSYE